MPDKNIDSCAPLEADWEVLASASEEQFDGHTEFYSMSPEERVRWLDDAVAFILASKAFKDCTKELHKK